MVQALQLSRSFLSMLMLIFSMTSVVLANAPGKPKEFKVIVFILVTKNAFEYDAIKQMESIEVLAIISKALNLNANTCNARDQIYFLP